MGSPSCKARSNPARGARAFVRPLGAEVFRCAACAGALAAPRARRRKRVARSRKRPVARGVESGHIPRRASPGRPPAVCQPVKQQQGRLRRRLTQLDPVQSIAFDVGETTMGDELHYDIVLRIPRAKRTSAPPRPTNVEQCRVDANVVRSHSQNPRARGLSTATTRSAKGCGLPHRVLARHLPRRPPC